MKIVKISDELIIEKVVETLKQGGLIIFPTETCYGVGVDATNNDAIEKLLRYKQRPEGKAISIAVESKDMAGLYVEINNEAENLYNQFLPGPLTVISKSKGFVNPKLESENGNLGVRIPKYPLMLEIIKSFNKPITSTSANSSGKKTPYKIEDIFENISDKQKDLIDLVIDAGELPKNPPSTVIDTTTAELTTYRQGKIDVSEISYEYISNSAEETITIGQNILNDYFEDLKNEPIIILLEGDLGSGKTHITKGFAKALKIEDIIKSPTYTYVTEYEYDLSEPESPSFDRESKQGKLYHFDAWRLENSEDLSKLGFNDWLKPKNVIVIEWPSVLNELNKNLFKDKKIIRIVFELEEGKRIIRLVDSSSNLKDK